MGRAENKERKKKRLCIFKTDSNNSIQIQIQRIQIQIEQQAIKLYKSSMNATQEAQSYLILEKQPIYFLYTKFPMEKK